MNKVEITNDIKRAIFHTYHNSKCVYTNEWGMFKTFAHDYLWHNTTDVNAKLLLTPLSEITDEDAIEVGKLIFLTESVDEPTIYRIKQVLGWVNPLYQLTNVMTIKGDVFIKIIDYLRSKCYDCGFAHIPSLISAGIAIKKN